MSSTRSPSQTVMRPDAARGEVEERRGTEAARADHERVRGEEALLRLLAELVQQQVAAVSQPLAVVHRSDSAAAAAATS